jgi:probable addiction module antidote protein
MAIELTNWDPAEHLETPEDIAAYIEATLEGGFDAAFLASVLGDVARSKGATEIARKAGISRDTLYKSLTREGDPRLSTLAGVLDALGLSMKITVKSAPHTVAA